MNILTNLKNMDNITQEQIDALIEFIDNTEEPASVTNVMAAAILAFLNLKVRQMVTVDDLNNEATARENTDTLLQDLIDALNQTAVRYSDVGEVIAELSTGTGMLLPDQSPLVIFKSMGAAYDGVQRTVTLYEGEASYPGSGNNYKYNKRGTVYPDMTVTSNRVYFNSYTGRLYKWAGSSFEAIGGGMDGAIYDIIKSNVNLVAAKLDALIGALAMLAFSGTVNKESLKVGSLSWVEPETHEPRIITPLDGSTLEFGNSTEDDVDIRIGLFIEGADLTKNLTLSITEGSSRFRLESGSSSITKDAANNGTTIYIIYNSSSSVANATGKLNIHSSEVDVTVNLHGTYSEQGGGDEPVQTPTISVSPSSLSFNAEVGQSAQQTFSVSGSNLTGDIQLSSSNSLFEVSPSSLSPTNGSVDATVTVTYRPNAAGSHSGTITASSTGAANKTVSLSGTATAAASTVNVVYKLLNISAPSTATQDQVWGYYKEAVDKSAEFNKELTVIQGAALNNDLTVKSGGVVKYKYGGSNNATGYAFSDGTLTITAAALALLTDDLIIEATACTGTVTVKASESGVTATIGGTTITCSTSNGDETYSGSASGITSINSMSFSDKTKIVSIDFGGAKFTGSTLASAFSGCTALTQFKGLVVTGSVTSLANMFENCSSLISLEAIGWNMPSLTSLYAFLYKASNITKFDASTWYAPNVANLHGMFASCKKLEEIDISGISTKNVNENAPNTMDIAHIFHLSPDNTNFSLTKLTIGEFDTSNVTNIETFFWLTDNASVELHCKSRTVPNISSTPSLIWFGNQNQSNNNRKFMISSVHVPTGCKDAYYNAWAHIDLGDGNYANYIGLTKEDFYEE